MISRQDLLDCTKRISPYIHRTPILTSRTLNEMTGANLYFKCENFQKMGAFKIRGALNSMMLLSDEQKERGVVTHSSGNFAQAIALAGQQLGIKNKIVMPSNAPQVKKDAVLGYGGEIIECEPTNSARQETANDIVQNEVMTFIHPSNDYDVIVGQGTAGLELLEDKNDLEFLLCPVGGGGLIAGCSAAAHHFGNKCRTIGGEPFEVDDAYRSLQTGKIEFNETSNTIADGLKTHLGDINFPIIQKYVDRIIRVEEIKIVAAMKLIWERLKIIIEPSCAVPFAAVLKEKEFFHGTKIGIVLSGGNVDIDRLPF